GRIRRQDAHGASLELEREDPLHLRSGKHDRSVRSRRLQVPADDHARHGHDVQHVSCRPAAPATASDDLVAAVNARMGLIDPKSLPAAEPKPGWHGRFFHSEHMTFAYYDIEAGAALHAHSHPNEEVWHLIDGEADVTLGDKTMRVGAGCAVVIP